ncbi:hypothetical protein ACFX2J_035067 [Malus domestica]
MPVAEALASGHVLALSSNILAHLFRCLAEATLHTVDPYQNGPLWVFQLWLQVYFASLRPAIADFSATEALGPQLASRPTPPHQAEEVFRYLFALDDLSSDEFLICRRRDYPPPSDCLPLRGPQRRMPLFAKPGGRSCLLATFLSAATGNGRGGKCTIRTFLPVSSAIFRAVPSPFSLPAQY